jgi:ribosomal protein S6
MMDNLIKQEIYITDKIYTIRDNQVMLDSDLAMLYQVETKQLNKAVQRNLKRFPHSFRFQLTQQEYDEILRFQNGTSSAKSHGGRRYLPYVFTEQGVSMLSAILRSDIAIDVSIQIIEAFVSMRRFLLNNVSLFQKVEQIEKRQISYEIKTDQKIDTLFKAIENKNLKPSQGIFYDGQMFDAYVFVSNIIKSAKKEIVLIDNYVDESVLTLFSKNQDINVTIYTHTLTKQLKLDVQKYNTQYTPITIKTFKNAHDRFLIVDKTELYHIGASLKDLGKKWFAFSKMDMESVGILERL